MDILSKIREGKPVEQFELNNIKTPIIPDQYWTIVRKENGEEFKRYLEVGKFTAYLNKISANNQNSEIDVQFRSIEGSPFYQQCKDAVYLLEQQFEKGETLGVRWLNNGNIYSFGGFTNEEAGALVNAFNSVIETSYKPEMGPANKFMDNFDFLDGFGE